MSKQDTMTLSKLQRLIAYALEKQGSVTRKQDEWTAEPSSFAGAITIRNGNGTHVADIKFRTESYHETNLTGDPVIPQSCKPIAPDPESTKKPKTQGTLNALFEV